MNMAQNIIAMIYDFDLTLSPHYMQHPIFQDGRFKIAEDDFWLTKERMVDDTIASARVMVDRDTAYLHHLIQMCQPGKPLEGLTRDLFMEYGGRIRLFEGLPEFFNNVKSDIENDSEYMHHGIRIEHYIASTGLADMLRGSSIRSYVEAIDSCEFFYDDAGVPNGVARSMTYTQKTEVLFKINKGVYHDSGIDVNQKIPRECRRVDFRNMIYYGDGPSDVPCMAVIKERGGFAFAVYNPDPASDKDKSDPARNAFRLYQAGRVDHVVPADYRRESHLYLMTIKTLRTIADRIVTEQKGLIDAHSIGAPKHTA